MNRKQRRAQQAQTRRAPLQMEVAIHEAGHAIAHLLTGELMGYAPEQAVAEIKAALAGMP